MCKEYINIQTGEKLDMNKLIELNDNAMLIHRPEYWCEWNFEKNDELEFDIWKTTKASGKKVWWICERCGSNYDTNVRNRAMGRGCSYCAGMKVNHTNSLASLNPTLAKEWHPIKNGTLTPKDVTCGKDLKVWWLGKCGHEWEAKISNRSISNIGCPYCSGRFVLVGETDMWTTNPELASLLADTEDGYKYMQNSGKKVNWKCPNCNNIIKDRAIYSVNEQGLSCDICNDGVSYPEKFIYNVFKELNIDFIKELSCANFDWIKDKRYDFYIESLGLIVECHGSHHYDGSFERAGGRTLEEERRNDRIKRELALLNGIKYYIELDCRESSMEYIKNSIMNSDLYHLLDLKLVDWNRVGLKSEKSLVIEVCDMWNKGMSSKDICKEVALHGITVSKYLVRGSEIGICNYTESESKSRSQKQRWNNISKSVVQLSLDGEYLNTFNSCIEASVKTGTNKRLIADCASNKSKSANRCIWRYLDDFNSLEELIKSVCKYKRKQQVEVVQLSFSGDLLGIFESLSDAMRLTGVDYSGITRVCKGVHSQAGGYKWMYKEEYNKCNSL